VTPQCNSLPISFLPSIAAWQLGYSHGVRKTVLIRQRRETGDGPIEKKRLLPIGVMLALAINVVVAILGYYAIMMWGLFRG
jgi:hypothetical protein